MQWNCGRIPALIAVIASSHHWAAGSSSAWLPLDRQGRRIAGVDCAKEFQMKSDRAGNVLRRFCSVPSAQFLGWQPAASVFLRALLRSSDAPSGPDRRGLAGAFMQLKPHLAPSGG
jgi:hypothetical protein